MVGLLPQVSIVDIVDIVNIVFHHFQQIPVDVLVNGDIWGGFGSPYRTRTSDAPLLPCALAPYCNYSIIAV